VPALAHLDVDQQIAVVDKLLEARPEDPTLYLRRGELHRIHKDWKAAEKDYLQARTLNPDLDAVEYCLGRMRLEAGDPQRAVEHLDRYLEIRPEDARGRIALGRALVKLGRYVAAADEFSAALASAGEGLSQPEIYLERARALAAAGPEHLDRALQGLDEGLEKLGEPVTLQLYAVELEVSAGRFDPALRRLDRLAAGSVRKEPWLMRKGAVLEAAGRPNEAGAVYRRALDAIDSLPASRRDSRAVLRMESEARAGLERVERAKTTP
jgi:predicted Zn-dependent protease